MSFFDDLQRFAESVEKFLKGKPKPVNLKSCKNCTFYKRGYCTQTPTPTKILSEYMAQGCIYYATEQITTGLISEEERKTVSSIIDRIKLIDLANVEVIKAVVLDVNLVSAPITVSVHETGTANVAITSSVQLDINIVASAITVNVHETGIAQVDITSSVTLNINIESSAITLNVKTAVGEKVEVGIVSSITLNINLASSDITLNIHETGTAQVDITSSIQLNINLASSDITLNIHETGTANVAITSSISLDVNITGSTIDVPIINATGQSLDVAITSSITVNMTITGSTVNVPVETTTGHVDVDVVTSITLNVNIESSAVTLNVNIQSQAVDINIKTSGGANIIIDKLTVGAYTERRSTLSNDNGVTTPTAPPLSLTGTAFKGKFFPRGCRGYLREFHVYCKRTGAGKLTLAFSPQMGMGEIATVNVIPSADWDWTKAWLRRFWNYDSMFVWVKSCDVDVSYGYDTTIPTDAYISDDSGASWYEEERRYFIRVYIIGETIGDIPVSGTINTIEIPSVGTEAKGEGVVVPNVTSTTVVTMEGAGTLVELRLILSTVIVPSDAVLYAVSFFADDLPASVMDNRDLTQSITATSGRNSVGEFWQGVDQTIMNIRLPIKFTRKLDVKLFQSTGGNVTTDGYIYANKIK